MSDGLTTHELLRLRPPDPRLCPKCKGMGWLYMPRPNRPEWDVSVVPCDVCHVDMDAEPSFNERQAQRASWRGKDF